LGKPSDKGQLEQPTFKDAVLGKEKNRSEDTEMGGVGKDDEDSTVGKKFLDLTKQR
jgi:hypothetical protein